MELNEIIDLISKSFAPYRCVAEPTDIFEDKIRFRVFGKDNTKIFTLLDWPIDNIKSEQDLKSLVETCKIEIRKKGFKID